jgi:hypothetical protein
MTLNSPASMKKAIPLSSTATCRIALSPLLTLITLAVLKAVSHLIGLGHRRIGLITNALLSYTAAQDRLTGYRQALALMTSFSLLTFLPL